MRINIHCDITYSDLYGMLSAVNRQISIARNTRRKHRRYGNGIAPSLEEDLRYLDTLQGLLAMLKDEACQQLETTSPLMQEFTNQPHKRNPRCKTTTISS